jgi:benzylsuccinate CoA-transferase BbsE subunit
MACELLKGFRMLDLADDKGALCGKIFADLGAEVIKVEPPGGCPTRRIAPFLEDIPGPDRSLYFLAYQAGKGSVTLNLDSTDGQTLLLKLVQKSDFLVESYPANFLDARGLGFETLARANPRIIATSITPFGDRGPGRNYKAHDIVSWASGGMMYLMGEEGRPPLQMSLPQAGLHSGAEAAVASLIAHYPRELTGRGQRVVVNMQACIVWTLMNEQAMPLMHGEYLRRSGVFSGPANARLRLLFRCADGYVTLAIIGSAGGAASTRALVAWMEEKGPVADWMRTKDWANWNPARFLMRNEQDRAESAELEELLKRFFAFLTKREIYAEALERKILVAPVATVRDIADDEQLQAREFFVPVEHDTLGRSLIFPGPFAKMSETPLGPPRRAPRLGEDNHEVYCGLLGLNPAELSRLFATGAI